MINYIISALGTIAALFFCRNWCVIRGQWDYFNFVVLAVLFFATLKVVCDKILKGSTISPSVPESRERMDNIEFLRVIFTTAILCCHFFDKVNVWTRSGYSVAFFFILSGFFLAKTYSPQKTILGIARNMIKRFVPLIVLAGALRCLFVATINWNDFFCEPLFLSGIGILPGPHYCAVSWYISVLFWISLLYFYILKTKKQESVNVIFGLIAFIGTVALCKRGFTREKFLGDPGDIGFIVEMRLVFGLAMVAIGYFIFQLYRIIRERITPSIKLRIICTILELFALGYPITFFFYKNAAQSNIAYVALVFSGLILLFTLKIGYIPNFFERKFWGKLAKYCLAVYLVQGLVVWNGVGYFLRKYGDWMQDHKGITIAATLIACWIAGIWAHHVIEKPCARFFGLTRPNI